MVLFAFASRKVELVMNSTQRSLEAPKNILVAKNNNLGCASPGGNS